MKSVLFVVVMLPITYCLVLTIKGLFYFNFKTYFRVVITDMRGDLTAPLMYLPVAEHADKVIQCR